MEKLFLSSPLGYRGGGDLQCTMTGVFVRGGGCRYLDSWENDFTTSLSFEAPCLDLRNLLDKSGMGRGGWGAGYRDPRAAACLALVTGGWVSSWNGWFSSHC